MCNAGVKALPVGLSKEGYEIQFATNHLGHALLIKLLSHVCWGLAHKLDPMFASSTSHPGRMYAH